jgi:predicted transcriptional regulator
MKVLSVKLPDELAEQLAAQAQSRGTTRSEILREALADFLTKAAEPGRTSSSPWNERQSGTVIV